MLDKIKVTFIIHTLLIFSSRSYVHYISRKWYDIVCVEYGYSYLFIIGRFLVEMCEWELQYTFNVRGSYSCSYIHFKQKRHCDGKFQESEYDSMNESIDIESWHFAGSFVFRHVSFTFFCCYLLLLFSREHPQLQHKTTIYNQNHQSINAGSCGILVAVFRYVPCWQSYFW